MALSKKVEVVSSLKDAGMEHVRVNLELRGGEKYMIEVDRPKGHPENPLSYDEIVEKFNKLSMGILAEKQVGKIIESVRHIDTMADIQDLCDLLKI